MTKLRDTTRSLCTYVVAPFVLLLAAPSAAHAESGKEVLACDGETMSAAQHLELRGETDFWRPPHSQEGDAVATHPFEVAERIRGHLYSNTSQESLHVRVERARKEAVPTKLALNRLSIRKLIIPDLLFEFDSVTLTDQSKSSLNKVVAEMKAYSGDTVWFTGHTDSTGPTKYNEKLGRKRALAARDYLVKNGVDTKRVHIRSFGETSPAYPNDSSELRALNRRVEIEYLVEK